MGFILGLYTEKEIFHMKNFTYYKLTVFSNCGLEIFGKKRKVYILYILIYLISLYID